MAPKKGKKIALSEFLGDGGLGSWADEVDALPNAPAPKFEGDPGRDDRFARRDDGRAERPTFSREEIPLPTQPPYTAFIGNLAFDLTEDDIGAQFNSKINSIKIIKDRDDRPKGFGYVEFETLDGLKDALSKTGSAIAGRTIRVSVAEPPKERSGFGGVGGHHEDDSKFDSPWRRDGPLPDLGRGDSNRRRFDGPPGERPPLPPSAADGVSEWRSSRPRAPPPGPDSDTGSFRRRGPGFGTEGAADREDSWTRGAKFVPPAGEESGSRFGGHRPRGEAPQRDSPADEGDWRSGSRAPRTFSRASGGERSPNESVPSTPQMGRRKLELLPRSGNASSSHTPLSSPKMSSSQPTTKPNPFGAAKPVDVTQREKQAEEKIEKEREVIKERLPMSRTNSRPAVERGSNRVSSPTSDSKAGSAPSKPSGPPANLAPTVRPTLSFASAAAAKKAEEAASKASDAAE